MGEVGYSIVNIDITIVFEAVRLKQYKDDFLGKLEKLLNISREIINFKIKSKNLPPKSFNI